MDRLNGAEAAVRMLQLNGVRHIFGLCGDTSLPFYDALFQLDHGMTHVLSRDERHAAYMADGYARVTGRVGVCEGPSGGGATYIVPGLVESNESCVPVLGITSDVPVLSRGRYPLTELDQAALYRPLTKWNGTCDLAAQIPQVFRTAFRAMTTGRPGSAHICLPYDVMKQPVDVTDVWAQPGHGSYPAWRVGADPAAVVAAGDEILAARSPLFICGGGVISSGATGVLQDIAELLSVPVATTVTGKGSMAETHPLCVGVVGSNGGVIPTREVVQHADLVVFVGCRAGSTTTEHWRFPSREIPIVHIDVDPMVISANYRTTHGLVGDARLVLEALHAHLAANIGKRVRTDVDAKALVARARKAKFEAFRARVEDGERPIRPERVLAELHKVLPRDSIVVADPGTPCPYVSGYYEMIEPGRRFITNRAHGALGYSLAAATGAWHGRPSAKCVAMMGDGSFGMCVGELETLVRYKVPLLMIVFSNATFGWIKASQKASYGERYYSVDFARTDNARIAEAYGVKSWRVEDPAQLGAVLKQAAEHGGPALVDVIAQSLEECPAPVLQWMG
jgi:acetolactate synthase-1/2/3 large subunit